MRQTLAVAALAASAFALGCHRELDMVPLRTQTVYVTDRFYDVQALSKDRAFIVGYGGKLIETTNGGMSWEERPSGVTNALYAVRFVNDKVGWISGQEGLILHTTDGGKTWEKQVSNATYEDPKEPGVKQPLYLFGLYALDENHAWAVGDRSILTMTSDGGKTWTASKVAMELDMSGGESLAAADPIFYDVKFIDTQRGWIVGEFGKIMRTQDGGRTWHEQEKSLLEGTGIVDLLDLPSMFGVHVLNEREVITSGLEGHIARTVDGGERWTFDQIQVDVPLIDPLFRITQLSDGTGWAVGAAGEVVKRAPGETAWKRAKLGQDILTWLRGISFSDPSNGWLVGGFGLIYRTTDGGKTWLPSQG